MSELEVVVATLKFKVAELTEENNKLEHELAEVKERNETLESCFETIKSELRWV